MRLLVTRKSSWIILQGLVSVITVHASPPIEYTFAPLPHSRCELVLAGAPLHDFRNLARLMWQDLDRFLPNPSVPEELQKIIFEEFARVSSTEPLESWEATQEAFEHPQTRAYQSRMEDRDALNRNADRDLPDFVSLQMELAASDLLAVAALENTLRDHTGLVVANMHENATIAIVTRLAELGFLPALQLDHDPFDDHPDSLDLNFYLTQATMKTYARRVLDARRGKLDRGIAVGLHTRKPIDEVLLPSADEVVAKLNGKVTWIFTSGSEELDNVRIPVRDWDQYVDILLNEDETISNLRRARLGNDEWGQTLMTDDGFLNTFHYWEDPPPQLKEYLEDSRIEVEFLIIGQGFMGSGITASTPERIVRLPHFDIRDEWSCGTCERMNERARRAQGNGLD